LPIGCLDESSIAALWLVPDRRIENILSADKARTRHKA